MYGARKKGRLGLTPLSVPNRLGDAGGALGGLSLDISAAFSRGVCNNLSTLATSLADRTRSFWPKGADFRHFNLSRQEDFDLDWRWFKALTITNIVSIFAWVHTGAHRHTL